MPSLRGLRVGLRGGGVFGSVGPVTFLRKTTGLVLATLTAASVWAPAGRAEPLMSGIGTYSLEAVQLYPYGHMYPWDTPGSPYREMRECADGVRDRLAGSARGSGLSGGDAYLVIASLAPVGCVLFNPALNAALDAQMRDVHGR